MGKVIVTVQAAWLVVAVAVVVAQRVQGPNNACVLCSPHHSSAGDPVCIEALYLPVQCTEGRPGDGHLLVEIMTGRRVMCGTSQTHA